MEIKKQQPCKDFCPALKHLRNKLSNKIYYLKNKEKLKKRQNDYYQANKESIRDKVNESRKNPEVIIKNRELRKRTNYNLKRKDAKNKWSKEKYTHDLHYRNSKRLRNRLRQSVKLNQTNSFIWDLVGCSLAEFKLYIESLFEEGMTWENHGVNGWHYDHKKPCNLFNLILEEDQKVCFHYSNIQPLWAEDNLAKSMMGDEQWEIRKSILTNNEKQKEG